MVAQITIPKSIKRALNYNEQKVQKGDAELIHAGNYLKLPEEMNFKDKLQRFENLIALNDRAQTKAIHISLNFHPSEKEKLSKELLTTLADEYMERIGFGNQPYLVYQHNDVIHPHVHIVSTLIKEDGSRINTHHLGKDVSDPARKEMEIKYDLISSNKKEQEQSQEKERVVDAQKVQYGKSETRRSIINVLDNVIDQYKYTSLAELNAVLKLYNVMADRGQENGRIYKNRGLNYRVLDKDGQKAGVPIKASSIYSKPTLDNLEKKFAENEQRREPDKKHLKNVIDWELQKSPRSLDEFIKALAKEQVSVVVRRSEQGQVYGLTYIDHEKKTVFNGSDLGKEYSAKRMQEKLGMERQVQPEKSERQSSQSKEPVPPKKELQEKEDHSKDVSLTQTIGKGLSGMIQDLMQPDSGTESLNNELKKEEEKRRRRRNQEREL